MRRLSPRHQTSSLLADRARSMRGAPTWSEQKLWSALCRNQLGVGFRRQVPVGGKYIADFLAPSARLIVEVDGGSHTGRESRDRRRDRVLERLGYRVVRLDAELVVSDLAGAIARVLSAVESPK